MSDSIGSTAWEKLQDDEVFKAELIHGSRDVFGKYVVSFADDEKDSLSEDASLKSIIDLKRKFIKYLLESDFIEKYLEGSKFQYFSNKMEDGLKTALEKLTYMSEHLTEMIADHSQITEERLLMALGVELPEKQVSLAYVYTNYPYSIVNNEE